MLLLDYSLGIYVAPSRRSYAFSLPSFLDLLVLPTTEENKDMDMVLTIAEAIHELGIDRRLDPVIAIGGGVCMDIVGFAASIYRRRTPFHPGRLADFLSTNFVMYEEPAGEGTGMNEQPSAAAAASAAACADGSRGSRTGHCSSSSTAATAAAPAAVAAR